MEKAAPRDGLDTAEERDVCVAWERPWETQELVPVEVAVWHAARPTAEPWGCSLLSENRGRWTAGGRGRGESGTSHLYTLTERSAAAVESSQQFTITPDLHLQA